MILMGHHCQMNGSTKLALAEYMRAYKAMPEEPLINLLIAVGYLSHVTSRRCTDRHKTACRAFAFLFQYAKLRQWSEEVYYNLGRALHQLSLFSLAVPCYEHVLVANSATPASAATASAAAGGPASKTSLKREAAYNLSLIYRLSGAHDMARQVLAAYCSF
jgi:general transcription factor 3C polypeptide 3 (transcription factor C subunit 4)